MGASGLGSNPSNPIMSKDSYELYSKEDIFKVMDIWRKYYTLLSLVLNSTSTVDKGLTFLRRNRDHAEEVEDVLIEISAYLDRPLVYNVLTDAMKKINDRFGVDVIESCYLTTSWNNLEERLHRYSNSGRGSERIVDVLNPKIPYVA